MEIKTAKDAADAYKSFDDWKYADREAAWKWMFEQGQIAEREACAEVCAALRAEWARMKVGATDGRYDMMEDAATICEDEIRARSNLK